MLNSADENEREPGKTFPGPNARQQYTFTAEEMRVLKECNKESFYQRSAPLSAILGSAVYYGVKAGYVRPNTKFGATPKVIVAIVVGYFAGKFSYQQKCAEKLMKLPNSQIGEMLRLRQRGAKKESLDSGFGPALTPFSSMNPSDMYSDFNPNTTMDLDTTRPEISGLEDFQRPSVDNPVSEEEIPAAQKSITTYEELRKKNREEYQQRRIGNYRDPPRPTTPPVATKSTSENEEVYSPSTPRNKYGDTWG